MRKVKNLAIFVLILALTSTAAMAAENTMAFEYDWFDLETGTVIPEEYSFPGPPTSACDFKFAYNSLRVPHAVIFQNQSNPYPGVEIAYSDEDFADVTFSDVADLDFTLLLIDIPFDKVAVLLTTEGNYFKVGPVSEDDMTVTFEWEQLTPSPADLVEDLAQAVVELDLDKGIENSLIAKLVAAYEKLTDDNDKNDLAAVNQLESFIIEVEAQRGRKIAEADADALFALAQEIIDLLISE